MKDFKTKEISIKVRCACVSPKYFGTHFGNYYDMIACNCVYSKKHGYYFKFFYMLKPKDSIVFSDMDEDSYRQLPTYVCKSPIY